MEDYDSLDELINLMHSCKADFKSEEMLEHILTRDWSKADSEEEAMIRYGCEIYKKMLVNYFIYDMSMEVNYDDRGIKLILK